MSEFLSTLIPFVFILFFVSTIGAAKKAQKRNGSSSHSNPPPRSTSSGRPAPLRTNVPKGNGEGYAFDRDGQPVRSNTPSRSGSYASASSYVPTSKVKDSTRTAAKRVSSGSPSSIRNTDVLFEDRQNDWLAKQLREEARLAKRTSDMFDLKYEHAASCDARDLKDSHERAHRLGHLDR